MLKGTRAGFVGPPCRRALLGATKPRGISRGLRVEESDFAGVDLGDRHLDGVFALADFLLVLAVAQLTGDVGSPFFNV